MPDFIHPCPGSYVSSKFGPRKIDKKDGKGKIEEIHKGIDYAKSGNVPILASADGVVKQYISDKTSYGNVIFIQHVINGKQMDTTYAHLKSKLVKDGDKVKQGQVIGYMGNTGGSTGQHLHFEIHNGPWKSGQPNAVDPMLYVDKESEDEKLNSELKKQVAKLILDQATQEEEIQLLKSQLDLYKGEGKQVVADWAKESHDFVKKNGISDGTRPNAFITRQEVWKIAHSVVKFILKGGK